MQKTYGRIVALIVSVIFSGGYWWTSLESISAQSYNNSIQEQAKSIAGDFERKMKFPPYSRTITEKSWNFLHPHEFIPFRRAIDEKNKLFVRIDLPSLLVYHGGPLPVTFTLESDENIILPEVLSISGEIKYYEDVLDTFSLKLIEDQPHKKIYQAIHFPDSEISRHWPQGLFALVRMKLAGINSSVAHLAGFKYVAKQAVLVGKKPEYVLREHLHIPLVFQVLKSGHYRVSANLFSKTTQTPIAHLSQKKEMFTPGDEIELKAHSTTLVFKKDPGPYILRDFKITRLPDRAGMSREYGASDIEFFEIPAHDLGKYARVEYKNPLDEDRLKFLKKQIENNDYP